jgi:hypothetical protein
MAKKKAAKRPVAKKAKKVARKPVKAAPKKVAKRVAKKVPKKAAKKAAPKPKVKAATRASTRATAAQKSPARPVRLGVTARRAPRDESAGIRIAPTAPERITHAPKPQSAPLKMPFAVPLERPIAPLELRPAPLFEREMFLHDDEE